MKNPIFTTRKRNYWKGQIRIGDVVQSVLSQEIGLVVETWTNHRNQITTVDVLWGEGSESRQSVFPSGLVVICKGQ